MRTILKSTRSWATVLASTALVLSVSLVFLGARSARASWVYWAELQEQTTCEALNPGFCRGLHGFRVYNNGRYVVGPGSGGRTITGWLTSSEYRLLFRDGNRVARTLGRQSCGPSARLPGSSDEVTLTRVDRLEVKTYDWAGVFGRTCLRGNTSASLALHQDLRMLVDKYYPAYFP